jgi:hypothetical protein
VFNDLYDREHIPAILKVPGVHSCRRYQLEWKDGDMLEYIALYEVDDPNVHKSDAWKAAGNFGGWKTEVRPFLNERRYGMYRQLD